MENSFHAKLQGSSETHYDDDDDDELLPYTVRIFPTGDGWFPSCNTFNPDSVLVENFDNYGTIFVLWEGYLIILGPKFQKVEVHYPECETCMQPIGNTKHCNYHVYSVASPKWRLRNVHKPGLTQPIELTWQNVDMAYLVKCNQAGEVDKKTNLRIDAPNQPVVKKVRLATYT